MSEESGLRIGVEEKRYIVLPRYTESQAELKTEIKVSVVIDGKSLEPIVFTDTDTIYPESNIEDLMKSQKEYLMKKVQEIIDYWNMIYREAKRLGLKLISGEEDP